MSGEGDDAVTLALVLLKRGATAGQILDAMGEVGAQTKPARRQRAARASEPERASSRPVNHAMVLAALSDAPEPLTAAQIIERLPALTPAAAHRHMYRGMEIGTVVQHGKQKPFRYMVSGAGRKRAAESPLAAPGGPKPEAPAPGGYLKREDLLAAVGRLGRASMATLREAFPQSTRTAIYQHVTKLVDDGLLSRKGEAQAATFALKGRAAKAAAQARPAGAGAGRAGSRNEEFAAALRKAGRPMSSGEVGAELFPDMRRGTVEQHLLAGVRKGTLVRIGKVKPFLYTVKPTRGKPADGRLKGAPKAAPVAREAFLAVLRTVTSPLTAKEIYKLYPNMMPHSVDTALSKAFRDGAVKRFGKKPYTYQSKFAAPAATVKNGSPTNGAPIATA